MREISIGRTARHLVTALSLLLCVSVRLRAARTGAELCIIGHADTVMSVVYCPDGRHVVTGCFDGTLRLWDATTGKPMREYKGHTGPVWQVSVSSDGKMIASASADHTVRHWNLENADQIGLLEGHTGQVRGVGFLPDGKVVSGGGDGIRLWDVATEKMIWHGDQGPTFVMAVSADGHTCAVTTRDDAATHIWNIVARKQIATVGQGPNLHSRAGLSANGSTVYAMGIESTNLLGAAAVPSGGPVHIGDRTRLTETFAMTPDDRFAVTAGNDIALWDTKTWQQIGSFDPMYTAQGAELVSALAVARWQNGDRRYRRARNARRVQPGRRNAVMIYMVRPPKPGAQEPAKTTIARGGKVTATVIPATVKTVAGETIEMKGHTLHFGALTPIDAGTDLIRMSRGIALHKTGGEIVEIYHSDKHEITDAIWDGKNIWIAVGQEGLIVLDLSGSVVARDLKADGLPSGNQSLHLFALPRASL